VNGEPQRRNAARSIWHSKRIAVPSPPKRKVGVRSRERRGGLPRSWVRGGPAGPWPPGSAGSGAVRGPPPAAQGRSPGATELGRGPGKTGTKSTALLSWSSPGSSRVGQPGAMVRRRAMPSGMPEAAAGLPAGLGSEPAKSPQLTQSIDSQQTAPPPGSRRPEGVREVSATNPSAASASGVANTIVLWSAPRGTSARKLSDPVTAPEAS
jgi:hypothetical protein